MTFRFCKSILLCLLLLFVVAAKANDSILHTRYTETNPLLYEDVWDMAPYAYLNEHGQPRGFNIDLVQAICNRLGIPVRFKLRPYGESLEALKDDNCDLTIGIYINQRKQYGLFGDNTITILTYSTLGPKTWANRVRNEDDLLNNKVIIRKNSFCDYMMQGKGLQGNGISEDDMIQAAMLIEETDTGQILYNTMSAKWIKRQYNLDNLVITPVDMKHAEYRFIGHDKELLHAMDSVFTIMNTDSELQPLRNKWFYPEHADQEKAKNVWTMVFLSAIAIFFILLFYQLIYKLRLRRMQAHIKRENNRLRFIQEAGNVRMWTYDLHKDTFTTYHANGKVAHNYSSQKFYVQYSTEDAGQIKTAILDIMEGRASNVSLIAQRFVRKDPLNKHIFNLEISAMQKSFGQVTSIIGTTRDFTKEQREQEEANKLMLRYTSIFDASTLAIVYYNGNGIIKDMNATAMKIFGITNKNAYIHSQRTIWDVKNLDAIEFKKQSVLFFSTINDLNYQKWASPLIHINNEFYYENLITAVKDEQGKNIAYYSIGRDITELVKESHRQKEEMNKVVQATNTLKSYVNQLNNALNEGCIRFINYDPFKHSATFTKEDGGIPFELSQVQILSMSPQSEWSRLIQFAKDMDKRIITDHNMIFKLFNPQKKREIQYWQVISSPSYNLKGEIMHYKLLCRDVTKLTLTNMQLKEENKKAQETELLKRSFLKNMSYEIRIPLNAVIGFAELFESDHDVADEQVFATEIKKNTEKLLELVDDVLLLSKLDANMIEIKKEPIDFASVFESLCTEGWGKDLAPDVRTVVVSPYEHLVVEIDIQMLSYVIEHITRNSSHFTTVGFVQAKYEYRQNSLTILLEDTGSGISTKDLPHVFERFMRSDSDSIKFGTGLGLPISKAIIEKMGGQMELRSELGRGTWVWILLPCKATSMLRKQEIALL